MRLPILQTTRTQNLNIPGLFGGMNLRDSLSLVNDNQLTDCLNMWVKDGALRTRPGSISEDIIEVADAKTEDVRNFIAMDTKKHNIFRDTSNGRQQLFTIPCKIEEDGNIAKILAIWAGYGTNNFERISTLSFTSNKPTSYFLTEKDGTLYCYTNWQKIYKYENETDGWKILDELEDIYAPMVLIHCTSQLGGNANESSVMASGTMLEGFNLASNYYRMTYSLYDEVNAFKKTEIDTDGKEQTEKYCYAQFDLLRRVGIAACKDMYVKLEYTDSNGPHKLKVNLNGSVTPQYSKEDSNGYKLCVNHYDVRIVYGKSHGIKENSVVEFIRGSGKDNVIITAPYPIFDENDKTAYTEMKKKVFSMTECEWFGGTNLGLVNGTRLFLGGNRNPKEYGLVVWSGLNNPTYFPEDSYFYVGKTNEKVTGFGKQDDKLIIFKPREIWYTTYNQNVDITASDLMNQTVIDYASSSVFFDLTQISDVVGCPYPESIQFCNNRLVWLSYKGAVNTLVSNNQYNENNVYNVSKMIERKLQKESGKKVSAVDWNGYYCLSFDNKLYLMDYKSYGFTNVARYSKTEDSNKLIPWYYWELPQDRYDYQSPIVCIADKIMRIGYVAEGSNVLNDYIERVTLHDERRYDTKESGIEPINCFFKTKFFDFGIPHKRKNIECISMKLSNNNGKPIKVSYVTNNGTEQQIITLEGDPTGIYDSELKENKSLFPCIRNISEFGIKLACEGPMAIEGINIKYRITGSAR